LEDLISDKVVVKTGVGVTVEETNQQRKPLTVVARTLSVVYPMDMGHLWIGGRPQFAAWELELGATCQLGSRQSSQIIVEQGEIHLLLGYL